MDLKDYSKNLSNNDSEEKTDESVQDADVNSDNFSDFNIDKSKKNLKNRKISKGFNYYNQENNQKDDNTLDLNRTSKELVDAGMEKEGENMFLGPSEKEKEESISIEGIENKQELPEINKETLPENTEEKKETEASEKQRTNYPLYLSKRRSDKFSSSKIDLSTHHDSFAILKKKRKPKEEKKEGFFSRIKKNYKNSSPLAKFFLRYFLLFLVIYISVYLLFNGPVYWKKISYWQNIDSTNNTNQQTQESNSQQTALGEGDSSSGSESGSGSGQSSSNSSSQETSVSQVQPGVPQTSQLVIPKIGVDVPIVYVNSIEDAEIRVGLLSGVVHYHETALPGEVGNCFVFGHSSNYWWEKSSYNYVFALLDQMKISDKATIYYGNQNIEYEVIEVKIVEPHDTSVLNPTPEPILTLMTCTPPGTDLKRLIVRCKQTYPVYTPKVAEVPKENPELPEKLPREKQGVLEKTYNFIKRLWE